MLNLTGTENSKVLTMEQVIDLVRTFRNDVIKGLLSQERFVDHFRNIFKREVTKVKAEFIGRELKELLIQPVDLVHYATLINHIKETNTTIIAHESHYFFYDEVNAILKKYCF